nr:hypothetical protein [Tanacetum cinerariifolium]
RVLEDHKARRSYSSLLVLCGYAEIVDREDLHQLWILVNETLSIKQATKDKEKELWVELKRLFEPDVEDQLWTNNQNLCMILWNGANMEDQSLDDLFHNLKIYEVEVKSPSSTSLNTQNIAFMSSQNTDSTNESVSVVPSVTAASTKVLISVLPNVDNLSDVVIYSFFAMADGHADHESQDWKESRSQWNFQAGRNLGASGTTSIGFDMSKVERYNYHRRCHFAKKYRSPRDARNKDTQRRNVIVETSTSNALVLQCDGVGSYDWRFQADEEPTHYALMAFTSLSLSSSDNKVAPCTKACSKAYATLQSHYDKLTVD